MQLIFLINGSENNCWIRLVFTQQSYMHSWLLSSTSLLIFASSFVIDWLQKCVKKIIQFFDSSHFTLHLVLAVTGIQQAQGDQLFCQIPRVNCVSEMNLQHFACVTTFHSPEWGCLLRNWWQNRWSEQQTVTIQIAIKLLVFILSLLLAERQVSSSGCILDTWDSHQTHT